MKLATTVIPILFASGSSYSIDTLRQIVRDLLKSDPRPEAKRIAFLDTQAFVSELLKINDSLLLLGMQIQFSAGAVRLATSPIRSQPLMDYLDLITEKHSRERLSPQAVEVLSVVAFKQPVSLSEINEVFGGVDKRAIASRLVEIGFLDRRYSSHGLCYHTTQSFLDHFKLNSLQDIYALHSGPDINCQQVI
ncbi:MAG: SMC-Scp complex subunit ScpB [Verrucomicrobiae bacterium]|nr:SMC-Scp complex subunit ScpB [Verrucomicrobiae bacterium]